MVRLGHYLSKRCSPECVAIKNTERRKPQLEGETAEAVTASDGILRYQFHPDQADEITMRLRRRIARGSSKTFEVERLSGIEQRTQEFQSDFD